MDAIDQLELLAKGTFPPRKAKGDNDDDENTEDADRGPGDDQDPDAGDVPDAPDDSEGSDDAPPGDDEGMGDEETPGSDTPPDDSDGFPPGDGDDDSTGVVDGDPEADPDSIDALAEPEPDADGDGFPDDADSAPADGASGGDGLSALATQLISAERDFYAAMGHRGPSHHNTLRMMDTFHKLLRKFVRAATQNKVDDTADPNAAEEGPPQEGGDPDGDGFSDEEDGNPARSAMQKGYRAFAAKHGLDVFVGLTPLLPELRKSTYDFRDTENMSEVPEQFFMAYLVAFIEAAYVECCQGGPAANSPDKSAATIMLKLVTMIPRASNLQRVATKYNVTEKSIAKILKDKGIISVAQAAADDYVSSGMSTDADSWRASGAEQMVRSEAPAWAQVLPEHADMHHGGSRLRLVPREVKPTSVVNDRVAPMRAPGFGARFDGREVIAKASTSSYCRIHSPVDMQKTDTLTHAFAKCTCPG